MNVPPQRLGRVLTVLGATAMALTLIASVIAFVLVGQMHDTLDDSLGVTIDALETVEGTITVSREVVDSVDASLDAIGQTVTTLGDSTAAVADTLTTLHDFVATTLPTAIDGVQNALPTLKSVAGTIDSALAGVSRIPFGPNYQPAVPFADTIQQLIDSLDPLDADLGSLATNLDSLATTVNGLDTDLTAIQTALDGMRANVDSAKQELDRYETVTTEAHDVAVATRDDLGRNIAWMRVLVIVVGLALLATQALTVLVGRALAGPGDVQPAANASSPAASADPPSGVDDIIPGP